MLGNGSTRVFAYVGPCDMRKQVDGLSTLVREELAQEPASGDLYLFRNRRGSLIKILFYDHGGYCLLSKRLSKGTFRIRLATVGSAAGCEVTQAELSSLLTNAELLQVCSPTT